MTGNADYEEADEAPVYFVYSAERSGEGEVDIEFDDGQSYNGGCLFLAVKVLDPDDMSKGEMTLAIPVSVGPSLLAALLTDEQWEAVCNA